MKFKLAKLLKPSMIFVNAILVSFAPLITKGQLGGFIANGFWQSYGKIHAETTTKRPIPLNETVLDISSDINAAWKVSPVNRPIKWFAYYNNTLEFTEGKDSCVAQIGNSVVSEANGIWVACQDPWLPDECNADQNSLQQCHPLLKYSFDVGGYFGLRTLFIRFALFGQATLRLWPGIHGSCFDYSPRQDNFSPCEYTHVDDASATSGEWEEIQFSFGVDKNISFSTFRVDLIARFKNDVALLDKINGTDKLLCDGSEEGCTITDTPTSPTTITRETSTMTTPQSSTDPEFTTSTTSEPISVSMSQETIITSMPTSFETPHPTFSTKPTPSSTTDSTRAAETTTKFSPNKATLFEVSLLLNTIGLIMYVNNAFMV